MTRFSFSYSLSLFSLYLFSFFRFSLSCLYSVSMFVFFFLYHLSLLLPRSYFLSIGSPIHLCFIFLPVTVSITQLRYKLMPHLCFPCAFLPSGPTASHAPFPIFRHFCLCCVPLHFYLLFCPLQALCLDIKNPLPGSLLQEGIRFPYGSCLLHLVCCSFPIALAIVLCICSIRIALTFLFFLIALAQISGQTCLLLAVSAPSLRT